MVLFATFHGYGAAWLAVRMLFRPRRPVKLLGLTIFPQGMIPRHRERMAEAIGNAVGNELVSQQTINDALFGSGFLRSKIKSLVENAADDLMSREFPSLIQTLPESLREQAIGAVENLQNRLSNHIAETLKSESTTVAVREFIERQTDKLLSQRVSETIDETALTDALGFVENRIRGIVREEAFETRVREFVSERVEDLANTPTPLGEMFTPDFVAFARERVASQVQPIVHELAQIATSDKTKTQIATLIKTEVNDFYQQLPFYQKFFVSRETLIKEVDDLVNTTLPRRIEDALRGEAFAAEAELFLNTTIESWLARPLPELIGKIAPEKLDNLKSQVAGTLLGLVQGAEMQNSLSAYLIDTLHKIRPHSWRAIAERIHPEAAPHLKRILADALLKVLRRDEVPNAINSILKTQTERFLTAPIGKIAAYISAENADQIALSLSDRIATAAEERLPLVIAEFDIAALVKDKVNAYPIEKLESLVLSVAGQHLRTIELFGLVLGLMLGIGQATYFYFVSK